MSQPVYPPSPSSSRHLAAVLATMAMLFIAGFIVGGEGHYFSVSAVEVLPFTAIALLAYGAQKRRWLEVVMYVCLALTLTLAALLVISLGVWAVLGSELSILLDPSITGLPIDRGQLNQALAKLGLGAIAALLLASIGFFPQVRRGLTRVLPIDPQSSIHTAALVLVTAATLLSFVPLFLVGVPAITSIANTMSEQGQTFSLRSAQGMLLDETYGLIWTLPAAALAVGYGLRRNFRDTLTRLGMHIPTLKQVGLGIGCGLALVIAVGLLSPPIEWTWQALGWPQTDTDSFLQLADHFFSPLGAVVIGITAGLGEELVFRGVLQPRMGIWLSNLFFTSVHAFQYNWDVLLLIFLIGLVFGYVRKISNTTTSAIVHGVYDFVLIIAFVLEIPGLSS